MSNAETAFHESGHAVATVAVGLGDWITRATIVPKPGDYAGCVSFRQGFWQAAPSHKILTMLWAGPLAQRRHESGDYRPIAMYDTDQSQALAIARANSVRWEACRGEAEQILNDYWSLVTALAETLLIHKTLDGAVIYRATINARAAKVASYEANYR